LNSSHWYCLTKLVLASSGDEGTVGLSPITLGSAGANLAPHSVRGRASAAGANIFFGTATLPISESQTYHYRVIQHSGTPITSVIVCGTRVVR
jgi:hypothetical protein